MAALRLVRLEAWRRDAQARDWVDGDWDCLMAACHWAGVLTGRDPGADWRGTYGSPLEAAVILRAAGGMTRLVDRTLRSHGWLRTAAPASGDFGVITLDGARARFGAVRYAGVWLLATSDGLLETQARCRAAWTWPD